MMSDSWEMAQNWYKHAVICQDQPELKMQAQMSIFSDICMLFDLGQTRKQDGGKISIGSH